MAEHRPDGPDDLERRVEELESTVEHLTRDLWSTRDALIGARAENGTLKAEQRDLEVRIMQLSHQLQDQDSLHRLVGRVRRDRRIRSLELRMKAALGRGA